MQRTLFIINPTSGGGRGLKTWALARPMIQRSGLEFTELMTTAPGDATEATRQALEAGVSQVVAVGGDGTLNEVVNGYIDERGRPLNRDAILGVLAAGTGSDFSKALYGAGAEHRAGGVRSRAKLHEAILAITGRGSSLIDAGWITCQDRSGAPKSQFFINVASFGLGGDVSRLVNGWRGRLPAQIGGRARFTAAALAALAQYKNRKVVVRTDESEITVDTNLLVITNGRFAGGGMLLAPQASVDDGLFDVIITDRASRIDVVKELPRIRRGRYLENPKVSARRASEVSLMTDQPVPLDIDGESGGYAPAQLRLLPSVIRFASRLERE